MEHTKRSETGGSSAPDPTQRSEVGSAPNAKRLHRPGPVRDSATQQRNRATAAGQPAIEQSKCSDADSQPATEQSQCSGVDSQPAAEQSNRARAGLLAPYFDGVPVPSAWSEPVPNTLGAPRERAPNDLS